MKKTIVISLAITVCIILSMTAYSNFIKAGTANVAGNTFERVDLHRGIIKEANFVPDADWPNTIQSGGTGLAEAVVTNGAGEGSSQLELQNTKKFGANQLITYEGSNGQFYTAVIKAVNDSTVILKSPLEVPISNPQKIRNFYADPDHPNENGYKAIVDYALRNLPDLNKGKHVLLGDSWFDHYPRHFSARLSKRLPNANIINEGIGGNTTQDLLNRFEIAVANQAPDILWIMVGTNDYNQSISKETYAANIRKLIQQSNDLGARTIVFNASVGKPILHGPDGKRYPTPSNVMKALSHDYYDELESMLNY